VEIKRADDETKLKQAFAIRMEVFVEEQGVPPELEMDEYDESPEACHHYVVYEEGKPIGAGRFKTFEPGVAKMQRIAVLKSHRGTGVGRFLLNAMEDEAKRAGYRESLLDAQCSAESFYAKSGYRNESEEPFLDAGILHVRMRKRL